MAAGSKGIKAGRAFVEVGLHDKLQAGLRSAQRRLRTFGAAVSTAGMGMMRLGAMVVAPLLLAAKAYAAMGDRIAKMAKRTGLSVEALSGLEFAASQSGTSIAALEKGVKRMQMTITDAGRGLSTAKDALTMLGSTYDELKGKAPEKQFKIIAEKLSKVEGASKKAAIASMIFGRAGTQMLPMIADGAAGIEELQQKAADLGLIISDEAAAGAEKFTDAMDVTGRVVKMAAFHVGAALVPALMDATRWIVDVTRGATTWIKANKELIVTILKWTAGLIAVGAAVFILGKVVAVVAALVTVFKAAVIAAHALGVAFSFLAAHPVVAVLAAVAAVAGAIAYAMRDAKDQTAELTKEILDLEKENQKAARRRRADARKAAAEAGDANARKKIADADREAAVDIGGWRRMQAEFKAAEISRIEDTYARRVASIKARYAEERRRAAGHSNWLTGVYTAEQAALHTAWLAQRRSKAKAEAGEAERAAKAAEQADRRKREHVSGENIQRARDVEELRLRATKKGHGLEVSLLALRRKRAIETAADSGVNLDLVKEEFDLRKRILEGATRGVERSIGIRGTFSGRALWGMGGQGKAADRTAKATEATAKHVKKIARAQQGGRLVFE